MLPFNLFSNGPGKWRVNAIWLIFFLSLQTVGFLSIAQDQNIRLLASHEIADTAREVIDAHAKAKAPIGDKDQEAAVTPLVAIPFWKTSWFLNSFLIFMIGLFFFIQQIRIRFVLKKRRALEKEIVKRKVEVLNQDKTIALQSESLKNLTEQNQSQKQELSRAVEKAARAGIVRTSFLSMISHGMRTPLNGLVGTASLLNETQLSEEQHEYLETIRSCGDHILTTINNIFDMSKIESGEIKLDFKDFNLRACVEDVLDVFAEKAAESELDLTYQIDQNVPAHIVGDGARLKQVLVNLLSNIINLTKLPEEKVKQIQDVSIGVHLIQRNVDQCILGFQIKDSGVGIPFDNGERMFKSFTHVDYSISGKYGGAGLGIANCENLVRLMGGSISMESHRGEGTIFSFSINTQNSLHANPVEANNMDDLGGKRVLIVENNLNSRKMLKEQLEQWSVIPTVASSGSRAIKVLTNASFDLVITDLKMPELDGVQLVQSIHKSHPGLPVILLTPKGNELAKKNEALFSSVLNKPVKQDELLQHLRKGMGLQEKSPLERQSEKQKLSTGFSQEYPLRILIAEDNPINQKLTERVLIKIGYKPDVVANGHEALEATREKQYDLILMDVEMPVMDGLEATELIRKRKILQPIILAMTANVMEGDREKCLRAGMNDYISKPVKLDELLNILQKWAAQRKKQAA